MTLTDIFCSSQVILPQSGSIFIAGGDNWTGSATTNTGNNNSNIFRYSDNTLSRDRKPDTTINNMNRRRWYSSSTVLANGEIYIQGGTDGGGCVRDPQAWRHLPVLTTVDTTGRCRNCFHETSWRWTARCSASTTAAQMYFVNPSGTGQITTCSRGRYLPQMPAGSPARRCSDRERFFSSAGIPTIGRN